MLIVYELPKSLSMDFLFPNVSCLVATCYKWAMSTCGYFKSRYYLVMFRAFTCCLLGVGHLLHDQVGKDDFVFASVSCLLATSHWWLWSYMWLLQS
jgi:hypothetical protein